MRQKRLNHYQNSINIDNTKIENVKTKQQQQQQQQRIKSTNSLLKMMNEKKKKKHIKAYTKL